MFASQVLGYADPSQVVVKTPTPKYSPAWIKKWVLPAIESYFQETPIAALIAKVNEEKGNVMTLEGLVETLSNDKCPFCGESASVNGCFSEVFEKAAFNFVRNDPETAQDVSDWQD